MKDYRLFNIDDFLADDDFVRWVVEGRKEDKIFWDNWLEQNPEKYILIAEAKQILEWLRTGEKHISDEEQEGEVQRLLQTIRQEDGVSTEEVEIKRPSPYRKPLLIAAVLMGVLLASLGFRYFLGGELSDPLNEFNYESMKPTSKLVENVNTSDKMITFKLPDQSTIYLSPNSRVAYSGDFDSSGTRDIYLSGEASFNVSKNAGRPFRVFSNEIVTKVLGTCFTVRAFENDSVIQVMVRSGKVSVYSKNKTKVEETASPNQLGGIILIPNQELLYQKVRKEFRKVLLENPIMLVPKTEEKNLYYEEAPLQQVFDQLSKNFGISIVYDSETVRNCTITADLRNVTFFEKIDLICKAVGAKYEIIDGQVVIVTTAPCD